MIKNLIIYRYLSREIFYPFLLVLVILTFVLLMGRILQLMDLMLNKGVGVLTIGQLVLFLIPSFLTITIPIALLVAILIGLGRLSRENEILVMKSAGISLYQLVPPVVVLALATFAAVLLLQGYFAPLVNSSGRSLLHDIGSRQAGIGLKEQVFNDDFPGLMIFANQVSVEGTVMEEIFISDSRVGESPITIIAQRGRIFADSGSGEATLRLENGSTHTVGADRTTYRKMDFSIYNINLAMSSPASTGANGGIRDGSEMTPLEIFRVLQSRPGLTEKERNVLLIELHKRFSLPVTCLVFALLAFPLAMVKHRTAKSRAFVVALGVVISYYVLQLGGDALGETGKISPAIATWTPNLIMGILGTWFFTQTAQEKPMPDLAGITNSFVKLVLEKTDSNRKES